ncbi:uncharacterized protein LOC122373012 [Amphibalanus amphitrite]|uniref:uncharacterized protein LOC122373012 n=1 Tax=Amphibalanus amphitrite TaxID=1232801 RepID=UPI001C9085C4|nr:uncharacterized protein LOC122373012 [Amphibalanus amphitrite]XP_043206658.1 uncharacterized protein LOC122373012 [Amphibalanus amphitrite]XP_043206660.1 uncharacterized protein LOC122373012 [Amphibalanus amphitrite]XP_043206661.1 uncharacterized protein LOC122373012 [Amphibalanus amphitrite]XP_043206662.1 uncharacterized protein LOC122373012 [Amphibalanus amphitrite]
MPTIRCVLCAAKQPQDTVFQFPKHTLSQRQWMTVCNLEEVRPSMGVCVRHFERNEINLSMKVPRLSPGAVPTLHPNWPFEGRLIGTIGPPKHGPPQSNSKPLREVPERQAPPSEIPMPIAHAYTHSKPAVQPFVQPLMQPMPETFKKMKIPSATYSRLLAVQNVMKSSSVEKTIERLAVWFLRKESRIEARRHLEDDVSAEEVDRELVGPPEDGMAENGPAEGTLPAPVSNPPAPKLCHDLAEAELLQEMDVQLESEDDPAAIGAGRPGCGVLCDGAAPSPHWATPSAVISEPQLHQLLVEAPVRCPSCMQPVAPATNRISLSYCVNWVCPLCGIPARPPWHSTSGSGQVTTFDAVFAAAVTLSGCSPTGVQRLLNFVNMGRLDCGVFNRLTDAVVSPAIADKFADAMEANRAAALAASPKGLVVAGSYQVDTPDFSVSFGTYTLVDNVTGLVVAQSTVPHRGPGEPTRREELETVRRCLADLRRAEVHVTEFISDRHVGAQRVVARCLPAAKYSYDIRDAAVDVEKRLEAFAARPGYKPLKCWISYLKNHFWSCAKAANGNFELFERLWTIAAHHVVGVHYRRDDGNSCSHGPMEDAEEGRPWLEPGSPAHAAVLRVVHDHRTMRVARLAIAFRHESRLEILRAVDRQYTPKQEPCTLSRLVARKRAAVLDYCAHLGRPYARNGDNGVRHIRAYSRAGGRYLTRPVRSAKTYPHVASLLARVAERRRTTTIAEQTVLAAAG